MKKILYSILNYSFSLAVIVGIVFNLVGIFLVWRWVPTVSIQLVDTATFIQKTLDSTEDLLEISDNAILNAEDNITLISEATLNMAESMNKTSAIATSISDTMGEEFNGIVESTQKALTSLESSSKLVDDTLSFVASIPVIGSNYSNKTPLHSSVVSINESLDELPDNILGLQNNLDDASTAFTTLNENLENLSASVEAIQANLEEAHSVIGSYQLLVDEGQQKTEKAIEKLPSWVRWIAAGFTLLFIWGILLQAGLILYIRDLFSIQKKLELLSSVAGAEPK
jgi:prefoldin subunit 5